MTSLYAHTKAQCYFNELIGKIKEDKIEAVFSFDACVFNNHCGYRSYWVTDDVYIMFESKRCLIIRYLEVDSLEATFRELTKGELEAYEKLKSEECSINDFFNDVTYIYDSISDRKRRSEINLEYGRITEIQLSPVTEDYWKWENGKLIHVWPTKETFNDITLIMDNDNRFVVCAGDELDDGACWVHSKDAIEIMLPE